MHRSMVTFISIFLTLFVAVNYYIGLRTWQALGTFLLLPEPVFGCCGGF